MPHREPHKTIYLQWIGVDRDELTESDLSEGAAEVTWCQDKINDTDLEYRLVERKKCDCEGIGCEQCRPREAHAPATPATPTPEDYARLREYVVRMAGIHDDDCPADDTCDCSGKAINDSVNLICKVAEAAPTTPAEISVEEWLPLTITDATCIVHDILKQYEMTKDFGRTKDYGATLILGAIERSRRGAVLLGAGQGRKP